jgi:integrase
MRVWIFQNARQVQKYGSDGASWYVGYRDPDGKRRSESCGAGAHGKSLAEKLRAKRQAELITDTYKTNSKKTWQEFRQEYEAKIIDGMGVTTARLVRDALNSFERIVKPVRMSGIKTQTIDEFRAERRTERGKKSGSVISPASVNKELRHLKAALKKAVAWEHLSKMPAFEFEREPEELPTYVTAEHFAAIYRACDVATLPGDVPNVTPADWWRGLLAMAYMTGWRISEILSLKRSDVDLDRATAITRAVDNKGKRDELVDLNPVVIEHLKKLTASFSQIVFPWKASVRDLYKQFARIQEAASSKLMCKEQHEHTERCPHVCGFLECAIEHKHTRFCYVYGFHDLRRAFATVNAERLKEDELQKLMRHRSYLTTQKYVNMSKRLTAAVASLHVPEVLRVATGVI